MSEQQVEGWLGAVVEEFAEGSELPCAKSGDDARSAKLRMLKWSRRSCGLIGMHPV